MKLLGLDLGDAWIGSAISDALGLTCRPYQTVAVSDIQSFLRAVLEKNSISTIVVGCPRTLSTGGYSQQTHKAVAQKEALEKEFCQVNWILWDERLSSKRAQAQHKKCANKEQKLHLHSVAASFILQSYLDYQAFNKPVHYGE